MSPSHHSRLECDCPPRRTCGVSCPSADHTRWSPLTLRASAGLVHLFISDLWGIYHVSRFYSRCGKYSSEQQTSEKFLCVGGGFICKKGIFTNSSTAGCYHQVRKTKVRETLLLPVSNNIYLTQILSSFKIYEPSSLKDLQNC